MKKTKQKKLARPRVIVSVVWEPRRGYCWYFNLVTAETRSRRRFGLIEHAAASATRYINRHHPDLNPVFAKK